MACCRLTKRSREVGPAWGNRALRNAACRSVSAGQQCPGKECPGKECPGKECPRKETVSTKIFFNNYYNIRLLKEAKKQTHLSLAGATAAPTPSSWRRVLVSTTPRCPVPCSSPPLPNTTAEPLQTPSMKNPQPPKRRRFGT